MRFPFGMAYFQGLLLLVSGSVSTIISWANLFLDAWLLKNIFPILRYTSEDGWGGSGFVRVLSVAMCRYAYLPFIPPPKKKPSCPTLIQTCQYLKVTHCNKPHTHLVFKKMGPGPCLGLIPSDSVEGAKHIWRKKGEIS